MIKGNKIRAIGGVGKIKYSTTITNPVSPASNFDYVYNLLNLTYIGNIAYSIYGLDYEGSGGDSVSPTILTNSYLYENEKTYSWF
jgi:hypothetical protein